MLIVLGLGLIGWLGINLVSDWDSEGMGLVAGLIFAFVGLFIAFALPAKMEDHITKQKLETLQDGMGVQGNFFLGCGTVEGKMQYVYYYQLDSINYKMGQIPYDDVTIQYSDSVPMIETHLLLMKNDPTPWQNRFAIDGPSTTYIIRVPRGTIRQNFTLDAR